MNAPFQRRGPTRWLAAALALIAAYVLVAYWLLPAIYKKRHPALDHLPNITSTHDHHPGDPVNLALVGSLAELKAIMASAGWFPADPLELKSDLKIAADTVLGRPYDNAPVSNLYLWGRKEDFAFEQPVGGNPRERHHVRFWKSDRVDDAGVPLWAGAATFDRRVGFSHTTGQITHHIAGDVDAERDHVFATLKQTGRLIETKIVANFHEVRQGRNGGGDEWHTDGNLYVGILGH